MSEINLILEELKKVIVKVDKKKTEMLINEIINAKTIKIIGHGRSGYVGQCFSMRLKHLGLKTGQDLLIIISGSGKIKQTIKKSKKGKNILITMNKSCALAKKSDLVIELKAKKSKQPMRSLFEQSALIYLDAIIMKLMKKLKVSEKEMWKRHD